MSSTSSEPENAAPTDTVRTEQGQQSFRDGDQNKSRPWTQTSRSNSASLLTRALAANNEERNRPSDSLEAYTSTSSSQQSAPPPDNKTNNGVTTADRVKLGIDVMAAVAPASTGNLAGATNLGNKPVSSTFDLQDMSQVNSLFTSHRELSNGTRGRGTSLERTEKEKRVEDSPKGTYSTNPGDTALPPSPESLSPITLASNNPPTEGVRARYRSWRDVRPSMASEKAWSIGEQGSDDSQGQVEKSVKEAMTGAEPNNRSRKASHTLRFFKEGLPEDKSKKKDAKSRGRSKEGTSRGKGVGGSDTGKQRAGPEAPIQESVDAEEPEQGLQNPVSSPLERSTFKPISRQTSEGTNPTTGLAPQEGYFDTSHNIETVSEDQVKSIPPQLLAEIRKHHNLTPGAAKGSSFSRSIPVTASERQQADAGQQDPRPLEPAENENEDDSYDGADLTHAKSNDEEDESGEEQISSALFVPHHTSHEPPEREHHGLESIVRPRVKDQRHDTSNSQQWLEEHKVPSREVDKKYLGQEAKSRPVPIPSVKQQSPQAAKDVLIPVPEIAKPDQEVADDESVTTPGEESSWADTLDTTPAGSVKTSNKIPSDYSQHFHDHQHDSKQPLEAIELIPYRHQVGGHTTMWRFSRRAVCKQLNNRENEFYEKIERYHPQLLKFLPRCVHLFCPSWLTGLEAESYQDPTNQDPADKFKSSC
jgi:inositol-hexakisphosphate kinase